MFEQSKSAYDITLIQNISELVRKLEKETTVILALLRSYNEITHEHDTK